MEKHVRRNIFQRGIRRVVVERLHYVFQILEILLNELNDLVRMKL
jgi:hypothetical protein